MVFPFFPDNKINGPFLFCFVLFFVFFSLEVDPFFIGKLHMRPMGLEPTILPEWMEEVPFER
jgi:hypothetical protein